MSLRTAAAAPSMDDYLSQARQVRPFTILEAGAAPISNLALGPARGWHRDAVKVTWFVNAAGLDVFVVSAGPNGG